MQPYMLIKSMQIQHKLAGKKLRTASNLSLPSGFNQTGGDIYLTISSNS